MSWTAWWTPCAAIQTLDCSFEFCVYGNNSWYPFKIVALLVYDNEKMYCGRGHGTDAGATGFTVRLAFDRPARGPVFLRFFPGIFVCNSLYGMDVR